ncbi:hypothetical protein BJX61DRAFT_537437 [Aspergillus egyptiacus]|nr:hypothetical protein BJX61DRAFT_537437 [Aspergillus egyptiacus]
MRPALIRLLKRPSALPVLKCLVYSPSGIWPLDTELSTICIRCKSSRSQPQESRHLESWHPIEDEHPDTWDRSSSTPAATEHDGPSKKLLTTRWKNLGLSLDELEYESDIGHTRDIGTRLVDDPIHQRDFLLWLELLRYRQRRYGDQGTLEIWEGLTKRTGGIQLPVTGDTADALWESFVDLGLKRETILNEVVQYALQLWNDTGKRWPKLYNSIMRVLVDRGSTAQAVKWHQRLQNPHLSNPNDLIQCFNSVISGDAQSEKEVSDLSPHREHALKPRLDVFREICKHTKGHHIYSQVIPALVGLEEFTEAFRMHFFLTKRDDHAQLFTEVEPLLEQAERFGPSQTYMKLRQYADDLLNSHPPSTEEAEPNSDPIAEQPQRAEGSAWFPEEKTFKDDFGARVFATKVLNFDMVLSGLKMFSVSAIGPLSLREMAVRTRGSQDLLDKLERLEKEGISIGNGVFARLLRRLAAEKREIILSDLIHSDQHPDMLEDVETQESLLVSYYTARDARQYNLTLAILREQLGEGPDLLNIHIRKHFAAGEWTMASNITDDMLSQGRIPAKKTISFIADGVLQPRKPGRGPVKPPNPAQELAFLSGFLQRVVGAGASARSWFWREVLKRYGKIDSWAELRACCLWLARHYAASRPRVTPPSDNVQSPPKRLPQAKRQEILASIFTPQMLGAIVTWGFRIQPPSRLQKYCEAEMTDQELIPYVRGVSLLRDLKEIGVDVKTEEVRRACRQRLVILYGPPLISQLPLNRELRHLNPFTIDRVIADINRSWGEPPLIDQEEKARLYQKVTERVSPPSQPLSR